MNIVGVRFQGWSKKVYHYKNKFSLSVGDKAVVVDPQNQLQVVTVSHINCDEQDGINYKEIHGMVVL